jgi:Ni/Fe-hydrogenase subunit HybB-like protein
MEILGPLSRFVPVFLGVYLMAKLTDMVIRGTYVYLFEGTFQSTRFLVEMCLGVIVPFLMLLSHRVRNTSPALFSASLLIVLGIVLNRVNVFLVAYTPPYAARPYVPAIGEIAITVAMIAGMILCYRVIVSVLPVLPSRSGHPLP